MGIRILRLQGWQKPCWGSRWTMSTTTPGTRTRELFIFFKYAYDTCLYANFSMGIQISRSQGWQRPYRSSRSTIRTATTGTRTGTYIFEKMNYSLSWFLGLPFSLFTWTLDMAFVTFVTSKFGFPFKNWQVNMYHMHVWKKWTTPCPGPWGCCFHGSPGPSTWPVSHL